MPRTSLMKRMFRAQAHRGVPTSSAPISAARSRPASPLEHLERREAAGHREIVAAEGGGMHHAAVQPAEGLLVDVAPRHDRAARHVAAAQATSRAVMMSGSRSQCSKPHHLAGAAEAGLDFVADEERAVFAAELLRFAGRNRPRGIARLCPAPAR